MSNIEHPTSNVQWLRASLSAMPDTVAGYAGQVAGDYGKLDLRTRIEDF